MRLKHDRRADEVEAICEQPREVDESERKQMKESPRVSKCMMARQEAERTK